MNHANPLADFLACREPSPTGVHPEPIPVPPPNRPQGVKDAPIQVFVTAEFRERVNAAAHDSRVSMSEYVRRALEEYVERDEKRRAGAA